MPTLATNKYARFSYTIIDDFEAGIVLTGPEVKSMKLGQVNFKGSYVSIHEGKPVLVNLHISPYVPAKSVQKHYKPTRTRTLLLNKKEIDSLVGKSASQGLTLIPLTVYTKGSFIKLKIGIGRGKKKADKREAIKKRDTDRNIRRALKRNI
ncbi:SsrA-binding protein SmpB [Patescibacteria group bacterium]|nr:SsrA-binding protein SmpB [Patescibacteria group bacterium]MBU1891064.1 SsrA-binding protein SmpB [Patescibacteria group bacterium]